MRQSLIYNAQEVIMGKKSEKSEIWFVGIHLYHMLFGKFPFNSNSNVELSQMIVEE
jgi:serine/threonine protein kinase